MKFTIKIKLAATFAVVLAMLAGLSWLAISSMSNLNGTIERIVSDEAATVDAGEQLASALLESELLMRQHISASSDAEMNAIEARAGEVSHIADSAIKLITEKADPDEMALLESITGRLQRLRELKTQVLDLSRQGTLEKARVQAMEVLPDRQVRLNSAIGDLIAATRGNSMIDNTALQAKLNEMRVALNLAFVSGRDAILEPVNEVIAKHVGLVEEQMAKAESAFKDVGQIVGTNAGREMATLQDELKAISDIVAKIDELSLQNTEFLASDILNGELGTIYGESRKTAMELRDRSVNSLAAAKAESAATYENERMLFILIAAGAMAIGMGGAMWLSLGISRGLGRAVVAARKVAEGDLQVDTRATSRDEIGELMEAMGEMTLSLQAMTGVADSIARGDLTVTTKRRSEADSLGIALETMLAKLRDIVANMNTSSQNVASVSHAMSATKPSIAGAAQPVWTFARPMRLSGRMCWMRGGVFHT